MKKRNFKKYNFLKIKKVISIYNRSKFYVEQLFLLFLLSAIPLLLSELIIFNPYSSTRLDSPLTNNVSSTQVYQLQWNVTWGNENDTYITGMAADSNNYIYICGYTKNTPGGIEDIFLRKFDTNGNLIWNKIWHNPQMDYSYDIIIDKNDNIYICGTSYINLTNLYDGIIIKYNTNGQNLMNITWGGANSQYVTSMDIDDNGNIYATGYDSGGSNNMIFVRKMTNTGSLLWEKTWDMAGNDISHFIKIVGNSVYVLAQTDSIGAGNIDALLLKYDTDGYLIWNTTWGGSYIEYVYDLKFDKDNYGYILGSTTSFTLGSFDIYLTKFNSAGNFLWNRTWGDITGDYGFDMCIIDDLIYVAGSTYSYGAGSSDFLFMIWDTSGNQPWHTYWGWNGKDSGNEIVYINGDIYIAGKTTSFGTGEYDGILAKLSKPITTTTTIPGFNLQLVFASTILLIIIVKIIGFQFKNKRLKIFSE